jgi:hypothetical protein
MSHTSLAERVPPDGPYEIYVAVFIEMLERLNPLRRMRTCPRVIRRARHNSYRVKRPDDIGIPHTRRPTITIEGLPAAA